MYDLPSADGFKITSTYYGPSVAPWFEANSKERKSEFSQEVAEIGQQEDFSYSVFEFLYNHGEGWVGMYLNTAHTPKLSKAEKIMHSAVVQLMLDDKTNIDRFLNEDEIVFYDWETDKKVMEDKE